MTELERYDYELPHELIAQEPLIRRSDARLMVVDRARQAIDHFFVRDLPELLRPGDCLVLNDTKVVRAQLVGHREKTMGRWKGLFLDADDKGIWRLLCKTRGKMEPGERIVLSDMEGKPAVVLLMLAKLEGGLWAAKLERPDDAWAVLDRIGRVPLPHYIRDGKMIPLDIERYQTVYAARPGSVAAPTAGLHFTPELLQRAAKRGIQVARVTLHVGIGTFRPIGTQTLAEHKMHEEWCSLDAAAVAKMQAARAGGGRIVAVGTTTVRTLESAARGGALAPFEGPTDLFIRPPYEFRAVDALLTNFHLPRSTLLVLVRTFGGEELIRKAYGEAIKDEYRFFSYGDAMLIV
jgi:S-adenosylmethionine:tRNA ribosyltransferase-isomerase